MVEAGKLNIYLKTLHPNGREEWSYIDYEEEVDKAKNDTANHQNWRPFFTFEYLSDIPITDEYGEPLTQLNEEGFEEYVYPGVDVIHYNTFDVDEIRLREVMVFNYDTKVSAFQAKLMCFYFQDYKQDAKYEMFWVDIDELFAALENKEMYPWYLVLKNRTYEGFQFSQLECDGGGRKYYHYEEHPEVMTADRKCQFNLAARQIGYQVPMVLKIPKDCVDGMIINISKEWDLGIQKLRTKDGKMIEFDLVDEGKKYTTEIRSDMEGSYTGTMRSGCRIGTITIVIE